jgi:hypothetical protein
MLNKRNIFVKISARPEMFVKFLTIIVKIFVNTEMLIIFAKKKMFKR